MKRIVFAWIERQIGRGRALLRSESRSLRGRLLLILLVTLALLAGLEMREHALRVADRRSLLAHRHARAAVTAAATFLGNLEQLYRSQRLIAEAALAGRLQPDQVEAYLEDVRFHYDGLASVRLVAPTGVVLFAAPPPGFDNDVSDEPFFRALQDPSVSRYLSGVYSIGPEEEDRVLVASRVDHPNGRTLGFVAMEFYTSALRDFLPPPGAREVELLLDPTGRPAYSTRGEALDPVVPRNPDLLRAVRFREETPVRLELPGEELVGYAVPVGATGWVVAYLRPDQEALAAIGADTRLSMFLLILVIAGLSVAVLAVVGTSLRPLRRLAIAAQKLGSGDLSYRLPPAEIREFEPIVAAFNRMADRVESAQRELLEANRELENRVRERTLQLEEEHRKRLRAERLSTLGLCCSAIAHDLRNPLNTVSLCAQWLRARMGSGADERTRERLDTLEREVRRADRIIRNLLAFARTGEPRREPVDVRALVRELLDVTDLPPDIAADVRIDPTLPEVPADRDQLFQVLENLLLNAVQAMPEGGRVRIEAVRFGERVQLLVADTGPGVPEEMREEIFEPLVTTKRGGTGIGLALCKRIVEAHGGTISLAGSEEPGAAFRVELPLVAPEPEAAEEAEPTVTRTAR